MGKVTQHEIKLELERIFEEKKRVEQKRMFKRIQGSFDRIDRIDKTNKIEKTIDEMKNSSDDTLVRGEDGEKVEGGERVDEHDKKKVEDQEMGDKEHETIKTISNPDPQIFTVILEQIEKMEKNVRG